MSAPYFLIPSKLRGLKALKGVKLYVFEYKMLSKGNEFVRFKKSWCLIFDKND
jgi:hypothetical protein